MTQETELIWDEKKNGFRRVVVAQPDDKAANQEALRQQEQDKRTFDKFLGIVSSSTSEGES